MIEDPKGELASKNESMHFFKDRVIDALQSLLSAVLQRKEDLSFIAKYGKWSVNPDGYEVDFLSNTGMPSDVQRAAASLLTHSYAMSSNNPFFTGRFVTPSQH